MVGTFGLDGICLVSSTMCASGVISNRVATACAICSVPLIEELRGHVKKPFEREGPFLFPGLTDRRIFLETTGNCYPSGPHLSQLGNGKARMQRQLTRLAHAQEFAVVVARHAMLQAELMRMIEALRRDR